MLRTGEGDDEGGEAVERPPDHIGFTDRIVQVRILAHDPEVSPRYIPRHLLPVHARYQPHESLDRARDPDTGDRGAGRRPRLT